MRSDLIEVQVDPHPFGGDITALAVAAALASAGGWEGRLRYLVGLGDRLPEYPQGLRDDGHRVIGCDTPVWLAHARDAGGRIHYLVDAEARIVRGIAGVLLAALNARPAEEISAFDAHAWFAEIGLLTHLSPSRRNGVLALLRAMQAAAD